jgi:hypothetical protein
MKQYARLASFGNDYFNQSIIVSLILHALIAGIAVFAPMIPILKGKSSALKFHSTVRVDIIELPDEVLSQLDQPIVSTQDAIKALKNKAQSAYVDSNALQFKTKNAVKKLQMQARSAVDRLKALEALSALKQTRKKEVEKKGNVVTEGAQTPSSHQEGESLDAYSSMIHDKVKLRWALPFYLRQQEDLSGELIIFLDSNGAMLRKQIISSGNVDFDDFMNRTLDEALPFKEVPEKLRKDIRYDGIAIKFYAKELL